MQESRTYLLLLAGGLFAHYSSFPWGQALARTIVERAGGSSRRHASWEQGQEILHVTTKTCPCFTFFFFEKNLGA